MTVMGATQTVAVVTGGAHGIGAAIAYELSSAGQTVVIVDPAVNIDGTSVEALNDITILDQIVAAGGQVRLARISVTDAEGMRRLFEDLVEEFGHVESVVNVAGILRPTGFGRGPEQDWRAVVEVHLDGYLNVLSAALPGMATAGRGRIVGVTSGAGWRQADNGAYGCAKRAVAAITWELGPLLPHGVSINALSPIAATRMVAGALARPGGAARAAGQDPTTGAVALGNARPPEDLAGIGALMASVEFGKAFTGEVVSANGIEASRIVQPMLVEVVRLDGASVSHSSLSEIATHILGKAETGQSSTGGGTPRLLATTTENAQHAAISQQIRHVLLVSEGGRLAELLQASLATYVSECSVVAPPKTFAECEALLTDIEASVGPVDAVIVVPALEESRLTFEANRSSSWEDFLDEHRGVSEGILTDARWASAICEASAKGERKITMVVIVDATTAGGRSRAQAAAQLSRGARLAESGNVLAHAVSLESGLNGALRIASDLVSHLVATSVEELSGAELVVSENWVGLRSHPHPLTTVTYHEPTTPLWLIDALGAVRVGGPHPRSRVRQDSND